VRILDSSIGARAALLERRPKRSLNQQLVSDNQQNE
jgi:hypothetical protein